MLDTERGGCPCFTPSADSEAMELGTDRHAALSAHWSGDDSLVSMLGGPERDSVLWASEYIRMKACLSEYPIEFEKKRHLLDDDFRPIFSEGGTPDAVCGWDLFDLKWRERSYLSQMAAYALMIMQERGPSPVRVHLLFGAPQRAECYTISPEEAWAVVQGILGAFESPQKEPRVCSYCSWCSSRLQCPAFNAPAALVARGREDWEMQQYHVTAVTTPEEMSQAIRLSKHLRKWCDAVDFWKKDWMIKQGVSIPGYRIRQDKGDREITDLNEAARLSGIPVEKFIGACSCGIGALKKIWSEHYGVSEAQADKEINRKLEPVIQQTPTLTIVKEK